MGTSYQTKPAGATSAREMGRQDAESPRRRETADFADYADLKCNSFLNLPNLRNLRFLFFVSSWFSETLRLLLPLHQQKRDREQLQHDRHEEERLEIRRLGLI
jgi:hypothetical protein